MPSLSAATYAALFANMREVCFICEIIRDEASQPRDLRCLEANQACCDRAGCHPDELIGHTYLELRPPSPWFATWLQQFDQVARSGQPAHFETYLPAAGLFFDVSACAPAPGLCAVILTDLTARKKAEQELFLKSLVLDQIRDLVTVTDLEGRITYVNEAEVQMLGFTREELLGQPIKMYGEDAARGATQREIIDHTLREGFWRCEVVNFDRAGCERILDCRTQVVLDAAGNPLALCGISTDITERKRMEAAWRSSEEKYRMIIENHRDLLVKTDPAGRFLYVNPAYCELFDKTEAELLGTAYAPLVHPDDLPTVERAVALLFQPPFECAYDERAQTRHGWRWISWTAKAIRDEQGAIVALVGSGRDITERKEAEAALRRSEERYHLVDEASADFIYSYDRQGRFTHANASLCRWLGLSGEQIVGRTHAELGFPPEQCQAWEQLHARVYETGATVTTETSATAGDGSLQYFEVVLNPIHDAGGAIVGIAGTTRDIHARKQAEAQVQRQLEELRRWHSITLGREDRILELKGEVNSLLRAAGQPPRYPSAGPAAPGETPDR